MLAADTEDVALSFEQSSLNPTQPVQTDRVRHPIALFFHLFFRSAAIVLYLIATLFFSNFITSFVITITFLSMDFWTTKNITGRLLAGLRWWNYVDNDGKSSWMFESRKNTQNTNRIVVESTAEVRLFWLGLIISQLLWSLFFLSSVLTFKFKWVTIIAVAFVLNGSNLYGFLKCKFGTQQGISTYLRKQMFTTMFQRVVSTVNTTSMPGSAQPSSSDQTIPSI